MLVFRAALGAPAERTLQITDAPVLLDVSHSGAIYQVEVLVRRSWWEVVPAFHQLACEPAMGESSSVFKLLVSSGALQQQYFAPDERPVLTTNTRRTRVLLWFGGDEAAVQSIPVGDCCFALLSGDALLGFFVALPADDDMSD